MKGIQAKWALLATTMLSFAASGVASAQESEDTGIREIVVTAQKREQLLQ
jgi:hypothetical protein